MDHFLLSKNPNRPIKYMINLYARLKSKGGVIILIILSNILKLFSQLYSQMQIHKNEKKKRQPWTEAEDKALLKTKSQNEFQTWNTVGQLLQSNYGFIRNEKQCRDRYELHLKQNSNSTEWTEQDQTILFQKFQQISGKWSIIAASFEGRTGSFLKNQFYSKLRKGIRRINNALPIIFEKAIMNIPIEAIYRLVKKINSNFIRSNNSQIQLQADSQNLVKQFGVLSNLRKIANIDQSQLYSQEPIKDIRALYKQIAEFMGYESLLIGIQQKEIDQQFLQNGKIKLKALSSNQDVGYLNNNYLKNTKRQCRNTKRKLKKQNNQTVEKKNQKVKKIKKLNSNKKANKKIQQNLINNEILEIGDRKNLDEEELSEYSEVRADLFFQSDQLEPVYMTNNEYENNRRVESFPELDQELIFESDQQSSS